MGMCMAKYRMGEGFNHFCATIDGLVFFPIGQIHERMEYVKEIAPPGVDNLIMYFDSAYVCGT